MLNAYFESKKVVTERNNQILELFLEVENLSGNWDAGSNVEIASNGGVILNFWSVPDYYDDDEPEERTVNIPFTLYEKDTAEEIIAYFRQLSNQDVKFRLAKSIINDLHAMGILYEHIGAEKFAKCVEFAKGDTFHYYIERENLLILY